MYEAGETTSKLGRVYVTGVRVYCALDGLVDCVYWCSLAEFVEDAVCVELYEQFAYPW